MKKFKSILSILLAAVLLFSVLPMTALAAETDAADTGADGEYAETGALEYTVSSPDQLKQILEQDDTSHVITVKLGADITGYTGTEGDHAYSYNNYSKVRYWISVGAGKKILNLDGHTLEMKNDYVYSYGGSDDSDLEFVHSVNTLTLFQVGGGADLTIDGQNSSGFDGKIIYRGCLLAKHDAVDQRDLIEVDGGTLTVNSGKFMIDDQAEVRDTVQQLGEPYRAWYQMNGTALTVMSGNVTVNGGRFQGRGADGYRITNVSNLNGGIEVYGSDVNVTINGGYFEGVSHGNAAYIPYANSFASGKIIIRNAVFWVDHNDSVVFTKDHNGRYGTDDPGYVGINICNLDPNTVYYYHDRDLAYESVTNVTAQQSYTEVTQQMINDWYAEYRLSPVKELQNKFFVVAPRTGTGTHRFTYGISDGPSADAILLHNGTNKLSPWNKSDSYDITIDSDSFYYPYECIRPESDEVLQTVQGYVTFKDGSTVVAENVALPINVSASGKYTFDLNDLASVKSKLVQGKKYTLDFKILESFAGANYSIGHTCTAELTIQDVLSSVSATVTDPAVGAYPVTTLADGVGYSRAIKWYKPDGTAMASGESFAEGQYTAVITFKAKSGISFTDLTKCLVNGRQQIITTKFDNAFEGQGITDTLTCKVYFDTTPGAKTIVKENVTFKTPEIGAYGNFDCNVSSTRINAAIKRWYDPDTGTGVSRFDRFELGHRYRVYVEVTPTPGHILDSATSIILLNGKTAQRAANGLYICDYDLRGFIHSADVSIMAPAEGQNPDLNSSDGEEFTSYVEYWTEKEGLYHLSPEFTFVAGSYYRVYIRLTPKKGYSFADDSSFTINGTHAVGEKQDDGTYIIFATFSAGENPDICAAINFTVTWPVEGANPDFTISKDTETVRIYTGTQHHTGLEIKQKDKTAYLDTDDVYYGGETYEFRVTVSRNTAKSFSEDLKVTFNGKEGIITNMTSPTAASITCVCYYTVKDNPLITNANCVTIQPLPGLTPSYNANVLAEYADKYSAAVTKWYNATDKHTMSADEEFELGKEYWEYVTFKTCGDYLFDETTLFYINGMEATPCGTVGEVMYVYVPDPDELCASVTATVAAPEKDAIPNFHPAIAYNGDQFSVSATWHNDTDNAEMSDSDPFDWGKTYTATFTFNAKSGYCFDGETTVLINGNTVADKTIIDDDIIIAQYTWAIAAPDADDIVATIKTPVAGEKADYYPVISGTLYKTDDYVSGTNFRNGVYWRDDTTGDDVDRSEGTFTGGHNYTVMIYFTLKNQLNDFDQTNTSCYLNGKKYYLNFVNAKRAYITVSYSCLEAAEPTGYTVGDVDANGTVTNRDAVILDRYIAGWIDYDKQIMNMDAADIDRNGEVTNRDAVLLDRYIAGWVGYDAYIIHVG